MKTLLQKFLPSDELKLTIERFPLSVLAVFILSLVALALNHKILTGNDDTIARVIALLSLAYFWCGSVTVMAESLHWSALRKWVLSGLGVAGFAGIIFFGAQWSIHLMFLSPALLLLLMVAPYLRSGDDLSFWFYNRRLWFGVAVSYVALFMFFGGTCVALFAIQTLFDLEIEGWVWFDLWIFAGCLLGPIYALTWVPRQFSYTLEDCKDPPGVRFIANWISTPLVLVYLLILYAYFIKIALTGALPHGQLAGMVCAFGGAGIVTYLIAFPMRDEGSVFLKTFYKIFFPALILPVIVHFWALGVRILPYGMTEQRYAMVLCGVFLVFSAVGYGFFKTLPLRFLPMVLAGLLFLGSFGPWAVALSTTSQMARLEHALTVNNLLVQGKIVKAKTKHTIPFAERKNISSMIEYLCNTERDEALKQWFDDGRKKPWQCYGSETVIFDQLGFEHVSSYETALEGDGAERFSLSSASYGMPHINVKGFDTLIDNPGLPEKWCSGVGPDAGGQSCAPACPQGSELEIVVRDNHILSFLRRVNL